MYSLELVITVALAAVVIGVIAGFFIAQRTAPSQRSQRQLENQIDEMQQQQETYQQEVSEHFVETGQLLNQLTNSYRDVHNHLAKGAHQLAGETATQLLQPAPESVNDEPLVSEDSVAPPLDYAPKTSNSEPGMLNETFGLEKSRSKAEASTDSLVDAPK